MQLPAFPGMVQNRSAADIAYFVGKMQAAGLDPTNVATIIEFESAHSWSPAKRGPIAFTKPPGYAVGLIQFSPDTAAALGSSTLELEAMSFSRQLEYVIEYFRRFGGGRVRRLVDYYAAVFWPNAIGTSDDYIIASAGSPVYEANKGLDPHGNGRITTGDLDAVMQSVLRTAKSKGELAVVPTTSQVRPALLAAITIVVLAAGIGGMLLLRRKNRP